ncbi:MAG: endo-1,4-beta-xylanase, partial [Bacteroidaceae bacterium]|nr:endo-1,4-beta-xylanase [Bacteroidaceae bacterium]
MKKLLTAAVVALASIAGNAQESWKVGNPNDPTHYGYLADYDNLKEYVQRDKYPVFKLGLALAVPEYNNGGTVKKLSVANFDEIVAGNAMKMASCVDNNGNMNFNTVSTFVTRASAAGHQVYGHTLAWHSQQPGGWLRKLIQDRPGEAIADADTTVMKPIANKDFRTSQSVGWTSDKTQYNYSITFDTTNGMKVTCTKKASANYEVQYVAME